MKKIIPEYEFSEGQLNTISTLAKQCGLLEDTVKILYGRGIDDKEKILAFVNPSRSHFISPFKMSGMREAVELITLARDEGWVVVVYGDYDADGICASTIMSRALKDFGIDPVVYIPERRNGYGLNKEAVDKIFDEYFPQLFITVDCGISAAEEVEYIKEQGAEVIVTDHHELPDKIPDCICVNPKFDDGYIYDNLCGAGVALKVGVALNGESAYKYLDFAAIATVADSVPLTGENRDIVHEGLKLINRSPRSCYKHFIAKSESDATAQTISFGIAPRINAAGRMGDARSALDLFTETDENAIFDLSAKLTAYNTERQKCCDELYLSAKNKLKTGGVFGRIIMLWDESWNTGFVGIVAARLAEEYSRPAILFVRNGDMLKGSARSVDSVNIFEALKACSGFIAEFGGHAQAAGVNVEVENFSRLESAMNDYLAANYSPSDFEATVYVSGKLDGAYSARFAREIEMLEPFGVGNRRPVFELEEGALGIKPVKQFSPHISLKSGKIELMYFNGAKYSYLIRSRAKKRCIFEYNISKFRGREYVKGYVRDVICADGAGADCAEEIAVNNILTLACGKTDCKTVTVSAARINEMLSKKPDFGTVYIANEYKTLSRYNTGGLPVGLFNLPSGNLADCVVVSPLSDIDLSGFGRAVFLDQPPSGVRIQSLAGKEVIISDYTGNNYLAGISADRDYLLKIFAAVAAGSSKAGQDIADTALDDPFGFGPVQTAFALAVFGQLSLISFGNGRLNVHRGVKSALTNSELYNVINSVKDYENRT